jgi:hypothetical protein
VSRPERQAWIDLDPVGPSCSLARSFAFLSLSHPLALAHSLARNLLPIALISCRLSRQTYEGNYSRCVPTPVYRLTDLRRRQEGQGQSGQRHLVERRGASERTLPRAHAHKLLLLAGGTLGKEEYREIPPAATRCLSKVRCSRAARVKFSCQSLPVMRRRPRPQPRP